MVQVPERAGKRASDPGALTTSYFLLQRNQAHLVCQFHKIHDTGSVGYITALTAMVQSDFKTPAATCHPPAAKRRLRKARKLRAVFPHSPSHAAKEKDALC